MFDTLLNEVTLWNQSVPAVDKIVWYQYMDVGTTDPCTQGQSPLSRFNIPYSEMSTQQGDFAWLFGLYRSDKVTPKPVQCAFRAYPNECQHVHLPVIRYGN